MKNIYFTFGYYENNKFDKFTYNLTEKFKFIPSLELDLFRKYRISNNYCTVKHIIVIGIFNHMFEWKYFTNKNKWEYRKF